MANKCDKKSEHDQNGESIKRKGKSQSIISNKKTDGQLSYFSLDTNIFE
jgi:hypothetical protein